METTHVEALIGMLTVLGLLVLMVLPAVLGIAHERRIDRQLKQAGTDKTKILKANIWLTDIGKWAEMNEAWDAWVVAAQTPARATVESKLAGPGLDVEIMVEAAI
jgi:hypothetical protein